MFPDLSPQDSTLLSDVVEVGTLPCLIRDNEDKRYCFYISTRYGLKYECSSISKIKVISFFLYTLLQVTILNLCLEFVASLSSRIGQVWKLSISKWTLLVHMLYMHLSLDVNFVSTFNTPSAFRVVLKVFHDLSCYPFFVPGWFMVGSIKEWLQAAVWLKNY